MAAKELGQSVSHWSVVTTQKLPVAEREWREVEDVEQVRARACEDSGQRYAERGFVRVCTPERVNVVAELPGFGAAEFEYPRVVEHKVLCRAETEPRQGLTEFGDIECGNMALGIRRGNIQRQARYCAEPGGTEAADTVKKRRSRNNPVAAGVADGLLAREFGCQKTASRWFVEAKGADMDKALLLIAARLGKCGRRTMVNEVVGFISALAQDADAVQNGVDVVNERKPIGRRCEAFEPDLLVWRLCCGRMRGLTIPKRIRKAGTNDDGRAGVKQGGDCVTTNKTGASQHEDFAGSSAARTACVIHAE